MIIVAGRFIIDPNALADLESRLVPMRQASRQENGCLDYALMIEDRNAGRVFVFEVWRNRASQERHLQLPTAQDFLRDFGGHIRSTQVDIYEAAPV